MSDNKAREIQQLRERECLTFTEARELWERAHPAKPQTTADLDLAAIRARTEAATPGPWAWENVGDKGGAAFFVGTYYSVKDSADPGDAPLLSGCVDTETYDDDKNEYVRVADYDQRIAVLDDNPNPHDAEFIAHAREDMPALLTEIERLAKENAEAQERIADALAACKQQSAFTTVSREWLERILHGPKGESE